MLQQESKSKKAIPWKTVNSPLRLWKWARRCFQAAAEDLEDAEEEIRKLKAHIKTLEERMIDIERSIDAALRLAETNGNDNWYWDY